MKTPMDSYPSSRPGVAPSESGWAILLYALCCISVLALAWQSTVGDPIRVGALKIDRLSAFLACLVGGVGAVVFRYSEKLIDECESKERFLRWLAFTVIAAYVLMLAGNLLLLLVAWALVSVGLHELLTHYSDRSESLRFVLREKSFSSVVWAT